MYSLTDGQADENNKTFIHDSPPSMQSIFQPLSLMVMLSIRQNMPSDC